MFEPLVKLLESKGFTILQMRKGREPGLDIVAEKPKAKACNGDEG